MRRSGGNDGADFAGAAIIHAALHVHAIDEGRQRAKSEAAEFMPAETEIKPGNGPEFETAQRS